MDASWASRVCGVDQPEGDGGAFYVVFGALYADALHGVGGVAEAGGVDKPEQYASDLARVFDYVARGAGDVAHYGLVAVQQAVQ